MVEEEEVIAQRARAVASLTGPMMLANILNALAALIVLYLDNQLLPQAVLWAAVAIIFSTYTILRSLKHRGKPFPKRLGRRTQRRVTLRAAALGLLFAYPGAVILPATTGTSQAFFVALAAGTVAAGTVALYPMPAAALTFGGIVATGSLMGFAATANTTIIGFTICTLVFYYVVSNSISRHEKIFVSEFESRRALDRQNREISSRLEQARAEAIAERKKAEARMVQAQKMEAIGQLTGGIAHDFNNLLATIQGHTELLAMEPGTDHTLTDPILRSTKSGAELTRRLLAFARRQTLKPQPVNLRLLTEEMATLLSRTLRENVAIRTEFSTDLWPVFADPNLLASALLNLANNARDAMPKGGEIHISATNLPREGARDEVVIRIRDTGRGMSDDVRARALEPFFTTREFG
ncbi:MAG: ATP-binding protein, partial [Pseudomonadota bacterium]